MEYVGSLVWLSHLKQLLSPRDLVSSFLQRQEEDNAVFFDYGYISKKYLPRGPRGKHISKLFMINLLKWQRQNRQLQVF